MATAPRPPAFDAIDRDATRLWSRADALDVDRLSTTAHGVSAEALMREAGAGMAALILRRESRGTAVVVLAGRGNNGGDALVVARRLHEAGCRVHVWLVGDERKASGLRRKMTEECRAAGVPLGEDDPLAALSGPVVIVDGAFGVGFTPPLREGPETDALRRAAAWPEKRVYAVDVPSGLDVDAWDQDAPLLPADVTVTFGRAKPCLAVYPARRFAGEVEVVPLAFAAAAVAHVEAPRPGKVDVFQCAAAGLLGASPWEALPPDAHKYQRGHVAVVGGDVGTVGAAHLAGMAALRAGAGWATLLTKAPSAFDPAHPELTQAEVWRDGDCDAAALDRFCRARQVKALTLGPGLREGFPPGTWAVLAKLQADTGLFLVIDAGALHGIFPRTKGLRFDPLRTLLTPHPGEWRHAFAPDEAALPLGKLADVPAVLARLDAHGFTVIHKGATPLVLEGGPRTALHVASPGAAILGKAGSGDVLAGTAAAHGAVGATAAFAAARAYANLTAAARRAAACYGRQGVIASDLIASLGFFN